MSFFPQFVTLDTVWNVLSLAPVICLFLPTVGDTHHLTAFFSLWDNRTPLLQPLLHSCPQHLYLSPCLTYTQTHYCSLNLTNTLFISVNTREKDMGDYKDMFGCFVCYNVELNTFLSPIKSKCVCLLFLHLAVWPSLCKVSSGGKCSPYNLV